MCAHDVCHYLQHACPLRHHECARSSQDRSLAPSHTATTATYLLERGAVWSWLGGDIAGKMSQFAHGISALDTSSASTLETPVWLLGREFAHAERDLDAYKQAFESILWFTYRRDYAKMEPYEYTSDAGWGCMLRSAQMLLSQALKRRLLGRDWRVPLFSTDKLPDAYVTLLRWFVDSPEPECIYSIHNMVKLGMRYDKLPGEWYGPTTAAQVLRDLVNVHSRDLGGVLSMYVPQEGVVYTDDVMRLCISHLDDDDERATDTPQQLPTDAPAFFDPLLNPPAPTLEKEWHTSLLVLIPLRLGLDQLNDAYVPALQKTFTFPQSVGIIGGKKGHSVYFVGAQDEQLHLLDPHDVHPTAELNASFPTAVRLLIAAIDSMFITDMLYSLALLITDALAHRAHVAAARDDDPEHRSVHGARVPVRDARGLR